MNGNPVPEIETDMEMADPAEHSPAEDSAANNNQPTPPEGFTVYLDEMKKDESPNAAKEWNGLASAAQAGDVIKNVPGLGYDYCITNLSVDTLQHGIYVRQSYIDIYDKIKTRIELVRRAKVPHLQRAIMHICGTPMIGKTMFLYYVLARLCEDFDYPGFVIRGIIPGSGDNPAAEFYSVGVLDKQNNTLHFEKTSSPEKPYDSTSLQKSYKGYMFLIDNARLDDWEIQMFNDTIIFASPKVHVKSMNSKQRIKTWWMPVWDRDEIDGLVAKISNVLPSADDDDFEDYDNMGSNINALMEYFGGTLGNMTNRDRQNRVAVLTLKAKDLVEKEIVKKIVTCGRDVNVDITYSSLIKVMVDQEYKPVGTVYISSFFTRFILNRVHEQTTQVFKNFWEVGAQHAAAAFGDHYEDVLAGFLGKNTKLKMKCQPHKHKKCLDNLPKTQNLEGLMEFKFENEIFQMKNAKRAEDRIYCVEEQRLVRMWKNCKSIDFYHIQKRETAKNREGDDVQDQLNGLHPHVDDGYSEGYDVVVWQATAAKDHPMEPDFVATRLVELEEAILAMIEKPTLQGKHMKNSLLSGSVTIWLCYIQPFLRPEFTAPGQGEVIPKGSSRKSNNLAILRREAIKSKLQVIYGVADPYKQVVEKNTNTTTAAATSTTTEESVNACESMD